MLSTSEYEVLIRSPLVWIALAAALVVFLALIGMWVYLRSAQVRYSRESEQKITLALIKEAQLQQQVEGLRERLRAVEEERDRALAAVADKTRELNAMEVAYSAKSATLEEQIRQRDSERQLLEGAKQQLGKEFENAAHRIFDMKQQQFSTTSKVRMEEVLHPFKQQLSDFNKRVEDLYDREAVQRNQLVGQISELQKQARQIGDDAVNLANALKGNNKLQGAWGEIVLERLLEQSGLEKGREYETQVALYGESGSRFLPDVVVRLPGNKDIVIDAKVSLLAYENYCSAEDQQDKSRALKAHVDSLRAHIKGLSSKEYEKLNGIRSLDFVFIFVPIESAFISAVQSQPGLVKEAYERNVILASPSSLMVALRTIEMVWRHEKEHQNVETIAKNAGKLYDQFVRFVEVLDDVGNNLHKATSAYDLARKRLVDGRGNLVKRVEDLKRLGARTSKVVPVSVVKDAFADDDRTAVAAEERPAPIQVDCDE